MGFSLVSGGDFNVVMFPTRKQNCLNLSQAMLNFPDFINELKLVDFPLKGGNFPGGFQEQPAMLCIDRL